MVMLLRSPYPAAAAFAPGAPQNLTANRDYGYTTILVTWDTPLTGVVQGYKLERSTDGVSYSEIATPTARHYRDTGLTRGETYYYKVRAYNTGGNSNYSNVDSDTVFDLSEISLLVDLDPTTGVYTDLAGSTAAADDDLVRRVDNQGSLGGYFDVADDGKRPTLKTNVKNGQPVLRFSGSQQLKDADNDPSKWKWLHDGTAYCLFAVHKPTDANAAYVMVDTSNTASANVGFGLILDKRAGVRTEQVGAWISRGGAFHCSPTTNKYGCKFGNWHTTAFRYDGALSQAGRIENDGHWGSHAVAAKSGTPSSADPTGYLRIGSTITDTAFFNGDYARLLVTDGTLTDTQFREVQAYLDETFGITPGMKWFGASSVIAHESVEPNHCAWPGYCVAANGNHLIFYNKHTSHTSYNGGVVYRVSTEAGATWGSEITLATNTHSGQIYITPTLKRLSTGRIILTIGGRLGGSAQVDGLFVFISDDNGESWTGPTQLNTPFAGIVAEGGGILELSNGTLLYPFYGAFLAGASLWSIGVMASTDEGQTWTYRGRIDGPTTGKRLAEPALWEMENGDIGCLIRNDTNQQVYKATSSDECETWGAATFVLDASGLQNLTRLANGALVGVIRRYGITNHPACIIYSGDGGLTWQLGYTFGGSPNWTGTMMTYGSAFEDDMQAVYATWGVENTTARSDIMLAKTV